MTISETTIRRYRAHANVFVETGTYRGDTVAAALRAGFREIYTIEVGAQLHRAAAARFAKHTHVHCLLGDSIDVLPRVLDQIQERALFWLDGHWSQGDTARGKKDLPLAEELQALENHAIRDHVILIDDIRLLGDPASEIAAWRDLSVEDVKRMCLKVNPNYRFSYEDGHVARDILVAQVA